MPFSRKPLMVIVDSSNSHAFKVRFTYLFSLSTAADWENLF